MKLRRLGLFVLVLATGAASGQDAYVSDELVITLRTGPSTQNAILRNLDSGTQVEILEQESDSGYARVRINGGVEGWVLARYLTTEPIARERLVGAERELASAQSRMGELEEELATVAGDLATARQRLEDAESANTDMNSELADIRTASANVLTLRDQNESLRRRLNERDQEVSELLMQVADLGSRATREWFVIGAAVLLAGIVLGLVLPSLRRRKRSSWGDF